MADHTSPHFWNIVHNHPLPFLLAGSFCFLGFTTQDPAPLVHIQPHLAHPGFNVSSFNMWSVWIKKPSRWHFGGLPHLPPLVEHSIQPDPFISQCSKSSLGLPGDVIALINMVVKNMERRNSILLAASAGWEEAINEEGIAPRRDTDRNRARKTER